MVISHFLRSKEFEEKFDTLQSLVYTIGILFLPLLILELISWAKTVRKRKVSPTPPKESTSHHIWDTTV
eukprot:m.73805 g.73805  ORF g.73805 m.73805 type:complete len:69 (+) comp12435_c0_seq4:786-992(+)